MSILSYLWRATRDDVASLGKASRPPRPEVTPKLAPDEARRAQVAYLDRNGQKEMSDQSYKRMQELLSAAQARPVGRAKKTRKANSKKSGR